MLDRDIIQESRKERREEEARKKMTNRCRTCGVSLYPPERYCYSHDPAKAEERARNEKISETAAKLVVGAVSTYALGPATPFVGAAV